MSSIRMAPSASSCQNSRSAIVPPREYARASPARRRGLTSGKQCSTMDEAYVEWAGGSSVSRGCSGGANRRKEPRIAPKSRTARSASELIYARQPAICGGMVVLIRNQQVVSSILTAGSRIWSRAFQPNFRGKEKPSPPGVVAITPLQETRVAAVHPGARAQALRSK